MSIKKQDKTGKILLTAIAAVQLAGNALAGTSTNTTTSVSRNDTPSVALPGGHNAAITISWSGQTALRNFSAGTGISFLTPGTSITFNNGPSGAATTYTATNTGSTRVQLGSANFTLADQGVDYTSGVPDVQRHSALRLEWHEQGSGEGLIDLINDQVGYAGGFSGTVLSNTASRGPSTSNPTWVNTNQFTSGNQTLGGHFLAAGNFSNTYDPAVYNLATGQNIQGGQNRIQFSVGEFRNENLSLSGTSSISATPGSAGYGLGNRYLTAGATQNGLGNSGGRQSFRPETIANQSTDKVNPESTTSATYAAGPWNTAGAANIDSKQIAVTAVAFTANPGTGLSRLNLTDTQWLQALGRLQNGADFNTVTRSTDTGQRIVAALNTGIDPSFSVGENDDGDTSGSAAAATQRSIGSGIRFSGKTSGTEARNVIAQSRMGFGPLSLAETRGASSAAPVRALDVDFNDAVDPTVGGVLDTSKFVHLNFDSIVNFQYKTVLISHFNTIKAANPALLSSYLAANPGASQSQIQNWWNNLSSAQTGIKGDTTGAVQAFINNVTNSTGTAAAGLNASSVNNPADALFINGFLIPQLLNYSRQYDGGPLTANTLNATQLQRQQDVKSNYGTAFSPDGSAGSSTQTTGTSATYGVLGTASAVNGSIPITANNYLFGNFNQNGTRDYSAVKQSVNAALSLAKADLAAGTPGKSSIFTSDGGLTNGTVIASHAGSPGWASTANTKGDLIVLGDYNSDGAFDGKDVYQLAHGASLSDSGSTDQLTSASGLTFGDQLRNPNAKLNKNAALDYARVNLTALGTDDGANAARAFVRQTGRAELKTAAGGSLPAGATQISSTSSGPTQVITYTYDPTGSNAFNKYDVNRDGVIDLKDAFVVDSFSGKSYSNLQDQLSAVISTSGLNFVGDPLTSSDPRKQISLVDVELTDDKTITQADANVINRAYRQTGAGFGDTTTADQTVNPTGVVNHTWTNTTKTGSLALEVKGATGNIEVPAGTIFTISAGSFTAGGNVDPFSDNTASGAPVGTKLSIVNNSTSAGGLTVNGGTKNIGTVTGTGHSAVSGSGAVLNVDQIKQSSLTLSAGGKLKVRNGPAVATTPNELSALSIDATSQLDIANNAFVVRSTDATNATRNAIWANILTGQNGVDVNGFANWDGPGIISSSARANNIGLLINLYAVGVISNHDLDSFYQYNATNGGWLNGNVTNIGVNDLLIRYTYNGDTNLDGSITIADYVAIDSTYGGTAPNLGWASGDLNDDGSIGIEDYVAIDTAYAFQTGSLSQSLLNQRLVQFGPAYVAELQSIVSSLSAVPEPTTLGGLSLGAVGLLARRRRRLVS